MNEQKLLLAQLTDLHATMMEVHSRGQILDMSQWITELSGSKEDSWCGTVACWLGWQALGNLENFPRASDWAANWDTIGDAINEPTPLEAGGVASRISMDLESTCLEVFGDGTLVKSLYIGLAESRWEHATYSELFSTEELEHPHLYNEDPTPFEAASYALLCIEKVKAFDYQPINNL